MKRTKRDLLRLAAEHRLSEWHRTAASILYDVNGWDCAADYVRECMAPKHNTPTT